MDQLWTHDVFFGFGGADTRQMLVDDFYVRFLEAGVRVFREDHEPISPGRGNNIIDMRLEAIRTSRVAIVIISETYTSSPWCLDELVEILKLKRQVRLRVLPLFYQVDPSELIRQTASRHVFDTAARGLVLEPERLRQWRGAVTEAVNLPGSIFDSRFDQSAFVNYVATGAPGIFLQTDKPEYTKHVCGDAYPSFSLSSGCWKHDVFLSFRGKNTRSRFISHLYSSLVQAGVRTYRDEEGLRRGEHISDQLLRAIQESSISIVVFSRDYAMSSWCLDELVEILHCSRRTGQLVLPVFYVVDPSEVRHQIGSLEEAFSKKRRQLPDVRLDLWKAALHEVANLSGWAYRKRQDESELVEKIMRDVVRKVNPKKVAVARHPVGLASSVENLYKLLWTKTKEARIIGIYGMGGLGKTVLAKAVYNLSLHHFECSSFLADVRKFSEPPTGPNSLIYLQEQLLSMHFLGMNLKVESVHHGTSLIKKCFSSKKVLFVIDDVDDVSQVHSIVERDSVGAGSRIILTTRDKHLLDQYGVDIKYKVGELDHHNSLALFCWHAFKKPNPPEEYAEVSHEMTTYAGGVPLALIVLGSKLLGRTVSECKSAFRELRKIPPREIQKKLELSYESLGAGEQDIFLDVACFFIGMDKHYVTDILDGCGLSTEYGIRVLQDRSLLAVSEENILSMHDLLRDMGREIVRRQSPKKPSERSRLWSHEDVLDMLRRNEGTGCIKGFSLVIPVLKEVDLRAFSRMNRLKLLHISNVHLSGRYNNLSQELRWLCWRACPLKHLPPNLHMQNLVVLDMQQSEFRILWLDSLALENLKILNVSHSDHLEATPNMSRVPMLTTLLLEGCTSLSQVHPSIGVLEKLLYINLKGCKKLRSLPDSICRLRSVEILNLTDCLCLEHLPNVNCVNKLLLDGTAFGIRPSSIGDPAPPTRTSPSTLWNSSLNGASIITSCCNIL